MGRYCSVSRAVVSSPNIICGLEVENTLDELKTHLNGRKTPIRSKTPRLVVQEIYGWLLAPYRGALFDVQSIHRCWYFHITRLAFTGSLRVLRRAPSFVSTGHNSYPNTVCQLVN